MKEEDQKQIHIIRELHQKVAEALQSCSPMEVASTLQTLFFSTLMRVEKKHRDVMWLVAQNSFAVKMGLREKKERKDEGGGNEENV